MFSKIKKSEKIKGNSESLTIGLLYVATGKYTYFWDSFYQSAEKYLFLGHTKKYFVFTDQPEFFSTCGSSVIAIKTPHLPWPYPTLYRYQFFLEASDVLKTCQCLYFFNSNMVLLKNVSEEILPNENKKLVVLKHPGYFRSKNNKYPYERNPQSTAFIEMGVGEHYYAGGLNGGWTENFLEMADVINKNVKKDELNGIIAIWHDESHINRYMLNRKDKLILGPRYGYPEGWCLWIGKAKIRILDKSKSGGHNYFRS